ncbi:MAG: ATP-dependent 6-phosphofructokinase [Candidatus Tectimicrobiota bacterium]
MRILQPQELAIASLGPGHIPSPLHQCGERCVEDKQRILCCAEVSALQPLLRAGETLPSFELAGPRARLFFNPPTLTCGLVTCGGLCPGINNTLRSVVLTLHYAYGVPRILGFRYGYAGLAAQHGYTPRALTPEVVDTIHEHGGTLLGSSRGEQDVGQMVDCLLQHQVQLLFTIGGDGTLRGAAALHREISRRGLPIAVIGIPKTIDNDLDWIERSFGFATAVEEARRAIVAAHAEARGAWNGIGLVKLMGRHAGFIAAHASLANSDVNFCLIPEVPFALHGEHGFLRTLERRLAHKHHAVIVVAEGAGQDILQEPEHREYDASGNLRLKDVGTFLKQQIETYCARQHIEITLKYIDPSYIIRSLPANSLDAEFCLQLGQHAVHAGLAGRTNMMVSYWNQHYVHVPIALAVAQRRQLDPLGEVWQSVLEATGQPRSMFEADALSTAVTT